MKRVLLFSCLFTILALSTSAQIANNGAFLTQRLREKIIDPANLNSTLDVVLILKDKVNFEALEAEFLIKKTPVAERARIVLRELMTKSNSTQGPILNLCTSLKKQFPEKLTQFESFWINNMVKVRATPDILLTLAENSLLEQLDLDGDQFAQPDKVEKGIPTTEAVNGSEIGLKAINAPALWAKGYTGRGRSVYSIDTGVDATHPAISKNFRGNSAPMAQSWFSPNTTQPTDCDGHGTHTVGTMVGLDPLKNDTIGVAFNAQWIGANGLCGGGPSLTSALQWAMNPDGDTSTVADIPDAINNSWNTGTGGTAECTGQYKPILEALEAAGVATVFSAGNSGPGTSTITAPKNISVTLVNTFTVGNLNAANLQINSSSSRGPSKCGGTGSILIKPEVSAPGTNVRSARPGGLYQSLSGTSMAAPHVAGAIALLKEAFPMASGTEVKMALYVSATDLGAPGEDNVFGMGIINLLSAFDTLATKYTPIAPALNTHDIAIFDIISPKGTTCDTLINPAIVLRNFGDSTISSYKIAYGLNGSYADTVYSAKALASSKTDTIIFPQMSISGLAGSIKVNFRAILPAGSIEPDTVNNTRSTSISLSNLTIAAPYAQGFEGATLEASNWIVQNPDNNITWKSAATAGIAGSTKSAYMNFFAYADSGQIDYLISPIINPPAIGYFSLNFKVAHRPYSNTYIDKLSVKTTSDCGTTFSSPLWSKQGSTLATGINTTTTWSPTIVTDWRDESISLNSFVGGQPFRLAFEARNGYGNNLYLDGISLVSHTTKPIASFTSAVQNGCAPYNVSLTSKVSYADSILWIFPGGATSKIANPTAILSASGANQIQLISFNQFGIDTVTQVVNISPDPKAIFNASDTVLIISTSQNIVTFTNQSTNASVYVWEFGDGTTSTQPSPAKIYTTPGKYTVRLISRNAVQCRDTVEKFEHIEVLMNPTSVQESKLGKITVYPNPSSDLLNINYQLKNQTATSLMIYNLLGEIVYSEKLTASISGNKALNVKDFKSGIYLLQVCTNDGCLNMKIQKH